MILGKDEGHMGGGWGWARLDLKWEPRLVRHKKVNWVGDGDDVTWQRVDTPHVSLLVRLASIPITFAYMDARDHSWAFVLMWQRVKEKIRWKTYLTLPAFLFAIRANDHVDRTRPTRKMNLTTLEFVRERQLLYILRFPHVHMIPINLTTSAEFFSLVQSLQPSWFIAVHQTEELLQVWLNLRMWHTWRFKRCIRH